MQEVNYVTKNDLNNLEERLERNFDHRVSLMESNLSEKLSNRINDTYWKLIPIMIGLMALVNGAFFIAYKLG